MRTYAIFQGGGAKGYAHIGALKAAEARGIEFTKVAGTSAGAIIAALVAAGFTADELLTTKNEQASGELFFDPLSVLNAEEYERITALMNTVRGLRGAPSQSNLMRMAKCIIGQHLTPFLRSPLGLVAGQVLLLTKHHRDLRIAFKNFGMTDTRPMVEWLDRLLSKKTLIMGRPVTFGDLDMRLRVVAANVTTGLLHSFGGPNDRNRPVASAVAASACFPFFFRPVEIDGEMFVDGGLVSNLPAWIFDEEREDDPSFLPTFGFRLVEDPLVIKEPRRPSSMLNFAQQILQTLQSGGKLLEERRIDDYYGIDLTSRIPTLSFHELPAKAPELVRIGQECVDKFFLETIGPKDPAFMQDVLRTVVLYLRDAHEWGERVRASVLMPLVGERWARVMYSFNMENDGDDRLRVRRDGLGIGSCLTKREPIFVKPRNVDKKEANVDRYEIAARPGDITSCYAIPIFENQEEWLKADPMARGAPFAALVIDTIEDIGTMLLDERQMDSLANVATIVGEQVRGKPIVRSSYGSDAPQSGLSGWHQLDQAGGIFVSRRKLRDIGDGDIGERIGIAIASIVRKQTQ